jgi:hypothetical protein
MRALAAVTRPALVCSHRPAPPPRRPAPTPTPHHHRPQFSGAQGWRHFPANNAAQISLRGNDGYKFRTSNANSGWLFGIWSSTVIKVLNSTNWKRASVPDAQWTDVISTTTYASLNAQDLDIVNTTRLVIAGTPGLQFFNRPNTAWATGWQLAGVYGQAGPLKYVSVSADRTTVFAADDTNVYAFDYRTGRLGWYNDALPIYTAPDGTFIRGIAGAPTRASPTATPSGSPTPSFTGTLSPGAVPSATPTVTASASVTATPTGTPSSTVTGRGGPLPADGFSLVILGNGSQVTVPNALNLAAPVRVEVYSGIAGCGAAACTTVELNRVVQLPRWDYDPVNAYADMPLTLNSAAREWPWQ